MAEAYVKYPQKFMWNFCESDNIMICICAKTSMELSKPFAAEHGHGKYDKNLPKVFVIGHNKTATRSIDALFKLSNYRSIHWDINNLASTIRSNLKSNLPLLTYINDYHCYSDMEIVGEFYAYELFPLFDLQYPGSLFIYNKRNIQDWIASRKNHWMTHEENPGNYAKVYQARFNSRNSRKLSTIEEVELHWRQFFEIHEKRVLKYFENKDNLIQLNIDSTQSQMNLVSRLSDAGFEIKDSLQLLPVVGATKKARPLNSS